MSEWVWVDSRVGAGSDTGVKWTCHVFAIQVWYRCEVDVSRVCNTGVIQVWQCVWVCAGEFRCWASTRGASRVERGMDRICLRSVLTIICWQCQTVTVTHCTSSQSVAVRAMFSSLHWSPTNDTAPPMTLSVLDTCDCCVATILCLASYILAVWYTQWLSIFSWTGSILASAYSRRGTAGLYCPHVTSG